MTADGFYLHEGGRFVPTGIGISPWNGKAQVGVALAGLVTRALETVPSPAPMVTTRLTIDILGAAPFAPLAATARVVREGPRLQLVEAELHSGDRAWVRASALRLRIADSPDTAQPPTRPFPEAGARQAFGWLETIRVEGDYRTPGPGALWVRIAAPLVVGEDLSPL